MQQFKAILLRRYDTRWKKMFYFFMIKFYEYSILQYKLEWDPGKNNCRFGHNYNSYSFHARLQHIFYIDLCKYHVNYVDNKNLMGKMYKDGALMSK